MVDAPGARAAAVDPATVRRAPADRVAHELDAVAHPELAQDVGPVRLDRLLGQVEDLGDLGVGVCLGDQLDHLLLARCQWDRRALGAVVHPLSDERALGRVGQERLAATDRPDRPDEVLIGLALEHVARRAGLQRLEQVAVVVVHREHQHARVGQMRADRPGGLKAGHARHPDIEDAQVRAQRRAPARARRRHPRPPPTTLSPGWRSSRRRMPVRTIP